MKLEECGHVFESTGLEKWFEKTPDNDEIVQQTCPQCKTDVVRTQRFMDLIKPVIKNVNEVKELFIGKQNEIHEQREQLMEKLRKNKFIETKEYNFTGYKKGKHNLNATTNILNSNLLQLIAISL